MGYELRMVKISEVHNVEDYWQALNNAKPMYFKRLKDAFAYCGGKLKRGRWGYSGNDEFYEYLALKCK